MKLELYLPKKLNNLQDLRDVIFDPIFLMDWLVFSWFSQSIKPYFGDATIKLFEGEKPFQSAIEKPPIFAIQSSSAFSINDGSGTSWMGALQLTPHRMRFSFDNTADNIEDTFARVIPVSSNYQIDAYCSLKLDINKFNLWFIDTFSRIGFVYQDMQGVRIENQQTGQFEPLKYYIYRGDSGFTNNWNLEGSDKGDVIHNATVGLKTESLFFRDEGSLPLPKKLILHYYATNFDLDNIYFYDPTTQDYLDQEDTAMWKEALEEELSTQLDMPTESS